MHDDHPLVVAARYLDSTADEYATDQQSGMIRAVQRIGIDLDPFDYVSMQRGLRAVLASTRGPKAMRETLYGLGDTPKNIVLTMGERTLIVPLIAAEMDGMAIGWYAHKLKTQEVSE